MLCSSNRTDVVCVCRYMPDAKEWLDKQIREAWTKGMQDRCKMHDALRDRQDVILPALAGECDALAERHAHRGTDSRSQTHLRVRHAAPQCTARRRALTM